MFRFNGNEIVKFKLDQPDFRLKSGDCGVIWGVYDSNPPFYEATFIDCDGDETDAVFDEQDVDEILDINETPFPKRLREIRKLLNDFEPKSEQ